ncbi:hypothetical protein SMG44B_50275 [Stenotrophomonas maltophilia]
MPGNFRDGRWMMIEFASLGGVHALP